MATVARVLEQVTAMSVSGIVLVACGLPARSSMGDPGAGTGNANPSTELAERSGSARTPHPFAGEDAWIAYQTNKGGGEGVWLIHPDGTDDHEVALGVPGDHLHPDWSPDGTSLVITSREAKDTLYELDLATDDATVLWECADPCIGDDEAVWSPDASRIAFVRAMEPFVDGVPSCALMLGDPASGDVEELSEPRTCLDRETFPHWSHDGMRIAYYRGVYEGDTATSTALFVLEVTSGDETKLTEDAMFAGDSDWWLDDEWLVFSTYPLNDFQCCQVSNLYRIHPDGSGLEQLTEYETPDLRASQPRLTPDGEWIVFTAVSPDSRVPWIMPADGGEPIAVAASGIYTHPTWQPGD